MYEIFPIDIGEIIDVANRARCLAFPAFDNTPVTITNLDYKIVRYRTD